MKMMKDSNLSAAWVQEQMRANPPRILENGNIFSGLVRLSFPWLFKPQPARPNDPDSSGRESYSAAVLFPLGADLTVFKEVWFQRAKAKFPNNWDPQGNPIGLHMPFHDQAEKAYGAKPLAGYTPGAQYFTASSQFKPTIVNTQLQPITDETKIYPGVWAFLSLNSYSYKNKKTGIGFGLQMIMVVADDQKLGGSGGGDPAKDFAGVKITAQSNIAEKFDVMKIGGPREPAASVMPAGGHVGTAGTLPIQPIETAEQREARELAAALGD
jgi:hypothetical protein